MAETKSKGDLAEAIIMADVLRRGYKVALPLGEDWRFDLIVQRNGKLERLQCKYTESNGQLIKADCRSTNNWSTIKYTTKDIDWLVVYDKTTDKCYYLPSKLLGKGKAALNLRLAPPKNNQKKDIRWAKDYTTF